MSAYKIFIIFLTIEKKLINWERLAVCLKIFRAERNFYQPSW